MAGPYRKVERITVHNDHHLFAVLTLGGLVGNGAEYNQVLAKCQDVGYYSGYRFTVFRDIESVYTIYYTPGE